MNDCRIFTTQHISKKEGIAVEQNTNRTHRPLTAPGQIKNLFEGAIKRNLEKFDAPKEGRAKAWVRRIIDENPEISETDRSRLRAELATLTYVPPKVEMPPKPVITLKALQEEFAKNGDVLIRATHFLREITYDTRLFPVDRAPLVNFIRGQMETHFRKGATDRHDIEASIKQAAEWMEIRLPRRAA